MHPNVSLEVVGGDCTVLAVGTTEGPLPCVSEQVTPQPRGVHGGVAAVGASMKLSSGGSPPNPAGQRSNSPRLHLWATHLFSHMPRLQSRKVLKERVFSSGVTATHQTMKCSSFSTRLVRRHCVQNGKSVFLLFFEFTTLICDMYTVRHGKTKHCAAR